MKFCFDHFTVAIWSSKMRKNIEKILPKIRRSLPDEVQMLFVWGQENCVLTRVRLGSNEQKFVMLKNLEKVWNAYPQFNASNTVLIDDTPYKSLMNSANNFIFPTTFDSSNRWDNYPDPNGGFVNYLERLSSAHDVAEFIEMERFGQDPIRQDDWRMAKLQPAIDYAMRCGR
ncbi:uncharacterized protein [Euphorbia lathyris]|uniref:uncharacterized protein n=1 Tax=Euphorbia lathyris TaxID=212925 RepID=UPI00331348DA